MKYSEVKKAIDEAERFIKAAKALTQRTSSIGDHKFDSVEIGKYSGSARRASLDLTRQLAVMRNPS